MCEAAPPATAPRSLLPGLHERDLAHLWEAGTIPPRALVTTDGTPLQVVYRGRPNTGAGPDFRDAVLAFPDGRLLRGDVELHLRASDFRRHGHDRDRAYDNVILHLVYRADGGDSTPLRSGRLVPVVALERWLSARASELQAMIEQPALWREPCQDAVERMGLDQVERTLARLGERRLRIRAAALSARAPGAALYERLLRTLGQGPQRAAWIELARRVPVALLERVVAAEAASAPRAVEALLLGAAGLLDDDRGPAEGGAPERYRADLRGLWRTLGAPLGQRIAVAGPRRPANHPARRLAGLARLLGNGVDALLGRLQAALSGETSPDRRLLGVLTVEADGLWRERMLPWGPPARTAAPALIGSGKALELALNAALPVLLSMAERDGTPVLADAVLRAYHALPSPPAYGRTAHLYRALAAGGTGLMLRADESQAALHLYTYYCTRGGCGRCPLS